MTVAVLTEPLVGPLGGRVARFAWRGIHLDSARTCFPAETVKKVITLAARYGFNRVHWHLTDDQGWRFEVPAYPRLTDVGAFLPRTSFDDYDSLHGDTRERAIAEAEQKWTNGFYTDADIADIVAHATELGVTIVPEIDVPGHLMAAILAYPELGRPEGLPLPTGSMRDHMWWPARNDLLWPTDAARDFVTTVVTRVTELFPGEQVHIGGDECAWLQWESDPALADWLSAHGLSRAAEIQAWFMDIAAGALRTAGRRVVVWDEATEIWDAEGAIAMAWDEERGLERIAKTAMPYVLADARTLYFNRIDPDSPVAQKGMVPGISVRDLLTAPWEGLDDERCLGLQVCSWSEFILDEADLLSMLFPRVLAVAERMWNPDVDVEEATARVAAEYTALRASGLLD